MDMKLGKFCLVLMLGILMNLVLAGLCLASGNLNVFVGGKSLEDRWNPVEDQFTGGFESDYEIGPISLAFGVLESAGTGSDSAYDYIGDTVELHFGVKKIFSAADVRPFIGGGLAIISGTYWYEDVFGYEWEDSDSAVGLWVSGGMIWALRRFNIGFELGYSSADITIFNTELDAGGSRFGMLFGFNW